MKYFDFHPKINYSFINKDINIIDIFRKNIINLSESNITNNTLFGNFVFPENIAHQYLEDPNQSWMITSLNNIVTNSDWYYPNDIKLSELKIKYNNQIIYSILTLPDLIENDIIIRGLSLEGPFGYVKKWDPSFRSITAIHSDDNRFESGNNISFWRYNGTSAINISFLGIGDTGPSGITNSTEIQKTTEVIDYPLYFIKGEDKVSPYYGISPGNTYIVSDTLAMNGVNGITYTILNKYNKSTIPNNFTYITTKNLYSTSTISNIKIPNTIIINTVESETKNRFSITDKYRIYKIDI